MTQKTRSSKKGTKSKTNPGDMNYTTKKGDKDFHQGGKDIKKKKDLIFQEKKPQQNSVVKKLHLIKVAYIAHLKSLCLISLKQPNWRELIEFLTEVLSNLKITTSK